MQKEECACQNIANDKAKSLAPDVAIDCNDDGVCRARIAIGILKDVRADNPRRIAFRDGRQRFGDR
jgi:hypothetical protein